MLPLVLAMLAILLVAALVVVYAAFPHRGEQVPGAPWLGQAMTRAAGAVPTLDDEDRHEDRDVVEGPLRG